MKKRAALLLLAWSLILAGCGTQDKTQELQQQKLTLELTKVQNEQLAALTKAQAERLAALTQKENELRALERGNQESLQEIERQKVSLQTIQEQMTQEKERLKAEEKRLDAVREEIRAGKLENQQVKQEIVATRAELERKLSAIREREEAERRAQEPERRAQELKRRAEEQKRQQEIADRVMRREFFLQKLATEVADSIKTKLGDEDFLPREVLLERLISVVRTEPPDDTFVLSVCKAAKEYYNSAISGYYRARPNLPRQDDLFLKAIDEFKKNYMKSAAEKNDKGAEADKKLIDDFLKK